jgi:hypothetical protein
MLYHLTLDGSQALKVLCPIMLPCGSEKQKPEIRSALYNLQYDNIKLLWENIAILTPLNNFPQKPSDLTRPSVHCNIQI